MSPPRSLLYADDAFLAHPLVTLLFAPSWAGSPPVYLCTGWELLSDEDRYAAARMHEDGVPVVFEEYDAMPHCFALVFPRSERGRRCFESWTGFIKRVVETPAEAKSSRFVRIKSRTLEEEEIDPGRLSPLAPEKAREMILGAVQRITRTQGASSSSKL